MGSSPAEAFLEHAKDVAVALDQDESVQYVNSQIRELLDYDPKALTDQDFLELIDPADREKLERQFSELEPNGEAEPIDVEARAVTSDGEPIWVETRIAPAGSFENIEWFIWLRDIHAREKRIRQLMEEHRRHKELFENTDDVLWMYDADWTEPLFISDSYEDMWGHSIDELKTEPTSFLDQVYPDHREEMLRCMERLSAGIPDELQYRVNKEEDYGVWVWIRATPIFEDGEVVRIAGLARDITELQTRNIQADVINNVLRHHVRNRLTVILGYTEALHGQIDPHIIDRITESSNKLLELQGKFGEILSILARKQPRREFDLVELTRKLSRSVSADNLEADIHLDSPPEVRVEAIERLPRAIDELLTNAVNHAPPSGANIDIIIEKQSGSATLRFTDENPPIPETEIQILTGEADVNQIHHGSGLGLWLVKWIVERSDGNLSYQRSESHGNILGITLPSAIPVE